MTLYEKFKGMNIRHSAIGLEQSDTDVTYYCTPKDANIIGWAGVDGIHYCTIPEFGEMIFAVSPMNFGDCVHPIAKSFEDLLCLLLSCWDMAALEQCFAWDEEQFKAFLIDCPATQEQTEVLDAIQKEFGLDPIEDVFSYVKAVQADFDLSKIPYTEEYYDEDMNPAAEPAAPEWKITFRGDFHSFDQQGEAGTPIAVNKEFHWAGIDWLIPEVYTCPEGLVVLTFGRINPDEVRKFLTGSEPTPEEMERMDAYCPLNIHMRTQAVINGNAGIYCGGSGNCWMPPMPGEGYGNLAAKWALQHYGLDLNYAWIVHRDNFRWPSGVKKIKSLDLQISQSPVSLSGTHFKTPKVGESVQVTHPVSSAVYTLTVDDIVLETADLRNLDRMGMEHPSHYTQMYYRITPDLTNRQHRIRDCAQSDEPRPSKKSIPANGPVAVGINAEAAAIGIIGGADGPTAMFVGTPEPQMPAVHAATSSLHFEPVEEVEWKIMFMEKLHPDMEVTVL